MRAKNWDDPEWTKLRYSQAAAQQMCYFRDQIAGLLHHRLMTRDNYATEDCWIAGWHTSKSVRLPVYAYLCQKGVIVCRHNFYDVNCTVYADSEISLPEYMQIDAERRYFDCGHEGMDDFVEQEFRENNQRFSFCKSTLDEFFAVMWAIAVQVRGP